MPRVRKSQPKPLNSIIAQNDVSSGVRSAQTKLYIHLLFHWKKIVGERNRKIMAPLAIQKNSLVIAVPNSMVKSSVFPILPLLLKKIHDQGKQFDGITFLRLKVDASVFPRKKRKFVKKKVSYTELSEEELVIKTDELIAEGISEDLAPHLAKLACFVSQSD